MAWIPVGSLHTSRTAAQSALDELQNSNISLQLVTITRWVQNVPAACRIHLVSRNPDTYKVYVFWIPYLAAEPYVWLNMKVTNDPGRARSTSARPSRCSLPGGRLSANGRSVNPLSVDTTLLSRYGPQQARKSHETLVAHGGDVFAKPAQVPSCSRTEASGSFRIRRRRATILM